MDENKIEENYVSLKTHIWIRRCIGIVVGICVVLVMIISSIEIAAYSDYDFYKKEYEKYDVNNPNGIVNMEMDELINVTKQMMSYLRGDREDMVIMTQIDGTQKEMFNDGEKYHMNDVRELFIKGLEIRRLSAIIIILGIIGLTFLYGFNKAIKSVFINIKRVILAVWAFATIVILAALVDFTSVFHVFHYIFFDNMEWILDPKVSRLINILPEGFFIDISIRIGVIYILLNLIILALAFYIKRGRIIPTNQKKNIGGTYEQG